MRYPSYFRSVFLLFVVAVMAGCSGAMTGVIGATLTRTAYPRVSVAANAPLVLQAHGRQSVSFETESMTTDASAMMDYAVYAENAEGPVTRHAHAFISRIANDRRWRYRPESLTYPGGLSLGSATVNGYSWKVQIIRINGERDWFSALWRENGRETPPLWIARRFSATPDNATRVVAEYREPWPECLDPETKDLVFARKECVGGFIDRSNKAFSLEMNVAATGAETPPSVMKRPGFSPDMKILAGELMEEFLLRGWR